jgi:two-component sensor histidine kinase
LTRLGELDIPERLSPFFPVWATQILFGLLCTGAAAFVRAVIDLVAPHTAQFALIFPAVLLATLFGRWQAGVVTLASAALLSWRFVVQPSGAFDLSNPSHVSQVLVNLVAALAVLVLAEVFRRAAHRTVDERNAKINERDLFLKEFDHRMKNNFMVVMSLLEMQRRRVKEDSAKDALKEAATRVKGIATAHSHLYRDTSDFNRVEMKSYLENLCQMLAEAHFLHGDIQLSCESDYALMPRDRAVSIGLIVNELVTNAAKHAFNGRASGKISVDLKVGPEGARLVVDDNGRGMPQEAGAAGGLGAGLVEAFAAQAGADVKRDSSENGTRVMLTIAP